MTAQAERLIVDRPQPFGGGVGGSKKRQAFEERLAFGGGGIRVDQSIEILQLQRKRADDAEPVARNTIHR
jgi:hypothetical protein